MVQVLVTGSTAGLGRATAEALLDAGHSVMLHARNDARADDLGALVRSTAAMIWPSTATA
jgi:NAD(P)-dependent dehydrogenase (short-subunit alcohol dehydrogenase family)